MRNHELVMTLFGGMFFGSFVAVWIVWMFGINAGVAFICLVPIAMVVYDTLKK